MHSILYYADLFIGDSQSMHVEAGLLGTPSIRSNKWVVSKNKVNVIEYLESEFNLGISIAPGNTEEIIQTTLNLSDSKMKEKWKEKRDIFFQKNTNFTNFILWFIENYPKSKTELLLNPEIIKSFI